MDFIHKLTDITWVKLLNTKGNRYLLEVAGNHGWCWLSPNGLCIAIHIDAPTVNQNWLRKITLLLAANNDSFDAGIVFEQNKAWLIHRYPTELTPVEQEAALTQQLSVVRLLASYGQAAPEAAPPPGKMEK